MSNLQFDFIVDRVKNIMTIRKEFSASRQLVWDAFTKTEMLEQWFAPKPFITKTKSMNFREGGHWHYAMISPDGKAYWGRTDFIEIKPIEYYTSLDAFSNEAGEIDEQLPRATWVVNFRDKGETSLVEMIITYKSLSDLETIIKMGMQEGLTATLEALSELLITLTKDKKMETTKITVKATVAADVKKAWDYYTNPKHITKWNFADPSWHCPSAENDMRIGGKYLARMEAKDGSFGFDFEAIYSELIPGEKFTYGMPDGRQINVAFNNRGDNTDVIIVFDAETVNSIELQQNGWQAILNNYKKYTENN